MKPKARAAYYAGARAAVQALREPTEAMLNGGPLEPYMDRDVWARMIDAAPSIEDLIPSPSEATLSAAIAKAQPHDGEERS